MSTLYRFTCGHVGRTNDHGTTQAFIRVAEIRKAPVENADKPCPDCR